MKLILNKSQLSINPEQLMRRAGYSYHLDRQTGRDSFVRRLGRDFYPRFHVYLIQMGENAILDLHLDQKRPRYAGVRAHNAEHHSEAVEQEAERIKSFVRTKTIAPEALKEDKKGFWGRIFGSMNHES